VAYRDKPDLNGDPNTSESKAARRYVFGLLPFVVLAPNAGRIAQLIGFKATYVGVLFVTIATAAICLVGGVMAYRNAQAQAARDAAEAFRANEGLR
jgi:hypothetical protein